MRKFFSWSHFFLIQFLVCMAISIFTFNTSKNFYKDFWAYVNLIIAIMALILYGYFSYREWVFVLRQKKTMRQIFASLLIFIVIGIFILLYAILGYYPVQWDFTKNSYYSLTLQSIDTIKKLELPIQVTIWKSKKNDQYNSDLKIILDTYKKVSPDKFYVRELNIDLYPQLYRLYFKNDNALGYLTIKKISFPQSFSFNEWNEMLNRLNEKNLEILKNAYLKSSDAMILKNDPNEFSLEQQNLIVEAFESVGINSQYFNILAEDLIRYNHQNRTSDFLAEFRITNALVSLVQTRSFYSVCSVQGHQEMSFSRNYSKLKHLLEMESYQIKDVTLEKPLDSTCQALVIASPKKPFFPNEVQNLIEYSNRANSKIILMLDPEFQYLETGRVMDLKLSTFLDRYSIQLEKGFLYDPQNLYRMNMLSPHGIVSYILHSAVYEPHPIVNDLIQSKFPTRFLGIVPIIFNPENKDYKLQGFLKTSPNAWIEKNKENDQNIPRNYAPSSRSSYYFGVLVESKEKDLPADADQAKNQKEEIKKESRKLVVIGDSDFILDVLVEYDNGKDLFLNIFGWLFEQKDRITVRPKMKSKSTLEISDYVYSLVSYLSYIIPLFILLLWVYINYLRRNFKKVI